MGNARETDHMPRMRLVLLLLITGGYLGALMLMRAQAGQMANSVEQSLSLIVSWNEEQSLDAAASIDEIENYLSRTDECQTLMGILFQEDFAHRDWEDEIRSTPIPVGMRAPQVWSIVAARQQAKLRKALAEAQESIARSKRGATEIYMVPINGFEATYPNWDKFVQGVSKLKLFER